MFNIRSTVSACEHVCSVSWEHSPSVECYSLIQNAVVETGLFEDVSPTVSDFLQFDQRVPLVHFFSLPPEGRPGAALKSKMD